MHCQAAETILNAYSTGTHPALSAPQLPIQAETIQWFAQRLLDGLLSTQIDIAVFMLRYYGILAPDLRPIFTDILAAHIQRHADHFTVIQPMITVLVGPHGLLHYQGGALVCDSDVRLFAHLLCCPMPDEERLRLSRALRTYLHPQNEAHWEWDDRVLADYLIGKYAPQVASVQKMPSKASCASV